eukprot:CAMPEP_0183471446 /NCGR_PEP_ID=MMETSP0370-20130417/157901_1 /TAXON_ID=268820 /ORGANISM="Peridinium aciculiferum, Strain PAER-2" /LENGTH=46 /DNA_ID= /DNA_START= /DNA_END= /DNA_ORIENTATION=
MAEFRTLQPILASGARRLASCGALATHKCADRVSACASVHLKLSSV